MSGRPRTPIAPRDVRENMRTHYYRWTCRCRVCGEEYLIYSTNLKKSRDHCGAPNCRRTFNRAVQRDATVQAYVNPPRSVWRRVVT